MAYIEYRIDNFGLQKHLPESVKKPIHRIKASSGIEKKTPIHRIFPAIHFDPGKYFFLRFCWISAAARDSSPSRKGTNRFQHGGCVAPRFAGAIAG